jgi:hypothetical protein
MSKTAVLAYSGGLDTTCIIAWLKELYDYDEVVAVLCDVGQEFDLEQSQERGYAAGADDVLLVDRREAFANGVRSSPRCCPSAAPGSCSESRPMGRRQMSSPPVSRRGCSSPRPARRRSGSRRR